MRGKSKGLDARLGSWAPKGGLLSWAVVNIFLVDVVYSAERVRNSDTPKQPEHCVAVDGVEGVLAAIQQGAQQICMDNARCDISVCVPCSSAIRVERGVMSHNRCFATSTV